MKMENLYNKCGKRFPTINVIFGHMTHYYEKYKVTNSQRYILRLLFEDIL